MLPKLMQAMSWLWIRWALNILDHLPCQALGEADWVSIEWDLPALSLWEATVQPHSRLEIHHHMERQRAKLFPFTRYLLHHLFPISVHSKIFPWCESTEVPLLWNTVNTRYFSGSWHHLDSVSVHVWELEPQWVFWDLKERQKGGRGNGKQQWKEKWKEKKIYIYIVSRLRLKCGKTRVRTEI